MLSKLKEYFIKASDSENKAINLSEKTVKKSSYDNASQYAPYNADDLYQSTGNYDVYSDMLNDDQVSVALQLKKDLILGSGSEFIENDEGQEDIIEDLETAIFKDPRVDIHEMLEEVLSAYEYGFSISEKIFKKREDGKLSLDMLKTRHPNTWLIHQDDKGNISKYEQFTQSGVIEADPKILIHYVNQRKFDNPYGRSDLRSAHAAWVVKTQIVRYYAIFLEKNASPTPVAKYPNNTPKKIIDDIYSAIKKFQTKTSLVIPKELELEFLESKSHGEAYEKAINIFNMFIGRSMFIPDLLGFQGAETAGGAYALGEKQLDVLFKHIGRRRIALERAVNDHIVKPVIAWNFGLVENPPTWRLKQVKEDDIFKAAELWMNAVGKSLWKPNEDEVNHFRSIVKFPEGDVEEKEVASPFGEFPQKGNPEKEKENPGKEKEESKEDDKEKKSFAKKEKDFTKRVNFKALESTLDSYELGMIAELRPVVEMIFEDLYDQIEKKKIVQNQKVDRIDSVQIKNLKNIKLILKKNLKNLYKDSQVLAANDLLGEEIRKNFAAPLPSEKFMELLEKETFKYVGDWEYEITKGARVAMTAAIKDGRPISSVIDMIDTETKEKSLVSLERYSRTKSTEVMNRARQAFFEESGIVAGYEYSAIMDDRTSDVCQGLDGKLFKAGTEPVPPLHFQCRSVLSPITIYEDFEPDTKVRSRDINEFIQSEKGTMF